MNKQDLVNKVASSAEISKTEAGKIVDGFIATVTMTLAQGNKVTLLGFGGFATVQRCERTSRNMRTGERMTIPARRAVKFRPGATLSEMVDK